MLALTVMFGGTAIVGSVPSAPGADPMTMSPKSAKSPSRLWSTRTAPVARKACHEAFTSNGSRKSRSPLRSICSRPLSRPSLRNEPEVAAQLTKQTSPLNDPVMP
jgi:hypothetical protein